MAPTGWRAGATVELMCGKYEYMGDLIHACAPRRPLERTSCGPPHNRPTMPSESLLLGPTLGPNNILLLPRRGAWASAHVLRRARPSAAVCPPSALPSQQRSPPPPGGRSWPPQRLERPPLCPRLRCSPTRRPRQRWRQNPLPTPHLARTRRPRGPPRGPSSGARNTPPNTLPELRREPLSLCGAANSCPPVSSASPPHGRSCPPSESPACRRGPNCYVLAPAAPGVSPRPLDRNACRRSRKARRR